MAGASYLCQSIIHWLCRFNPINMGNKEINFKHSGATGDIIFALPFVKYMGGGNMYLSNYHPQRAESIAKLLRIQDYIGEVYVGITPPEDAVNLDLFRQHAGYHSNLIEAYFTAFRKPFDKSFKEPWITLPESDSLIEEPYTIINRTTNYDDPNFDWKAEVNYLMTLSPNCYFLGYQHEYDMFQDKFKTWAKFHDCDFLTAAYLIKNSAMFTGGYSCLATIAQGLGINFRLVQAPNHTCSTLFVEREKVVNI